MHTPFAGGEVVRERPFLFLVFLRRASEGLLRVTGGGAELIRELVHPVIAGEHCVGCKGTEDLRDSRLTVNIWIRLESGLER